MSEPEAHLPGLDLNTDSSAKKPAKKAARKTATKKAARKSAAKKAVSAEKAATTAADTGREAPAGETAAKTAAARKAETTKAPAEAATPGREAAAAGEPGSARRVFPRRTERDADGDTRQDSRRTERDNNSGNRSARDADSDAVPTRFSASPDDLDDYGDVRERNRRERAEREQEKVRESDAGASGAKGEGDSNGRDGESRQKDGGQNPRYGQRPDNRPPFKKPFRQNAGAGEEGGEENRSDSEGRDNFRPLQQGGKPGNGQQPYGKKPFFQKGNGGQNPQGNGQQQQGGNPNKFQKFKKGDKFNPKHPANPQQAQQGGKKGKQPHPDKVKGGKKGSWQSQFAAASEEDTQPPVFDSLIDWELFRSPELLAAKAAEITTHGATPGAIADGTANTSGADATDESSAANTSGDDDAARESTARLATTDGAGDISATDTTDSAAPEGDDDRSRRAAAATDGSETTAGNTTADATSAGASATAADAADSEAADASTADGTTDEGTAGSDRPATPDAIAAAKIFEYDRAYALKLPELEALARKSDIIWEGAPNRRRLLAKLLAKAAEQKRPIRVRGLVELLEEGFGFIVFGEDNYRLRSDSPFIAAPLVNRYGLQRGHEVEALLHPAREGETTPFALRVDTVMGKTPEEAQHLTPFKELVPYYPTERILLESEQGALGKWDNISMRIVDLLSPIGLGQRGLIVAPPRTGKTVLMQGIANAIRANRPDTRLIILLVDERPEEVTDFRRSVKGAQVVASTFDEAAESHVHAAEMVIEKARRLVETGEDVIILLDSITRLARAYNTTMPSSGKILSGGVEASALQKPKRFFGSARNIEGGGSLTILGTALVETGSKMDEVIFEEFKGTGNMELHLDRDLSNKRVFPALSFEKSGTRKEELLYHPDEMEKVHALRRAMKGVPSTDAMEMLIQRVKRSKTNAQFLMSMAR